MNVASAAQSGASVQMREAARPTLSSEAPVFRRATSPGQVPEKFDASEQRAVFADDAVDGVWRVGPVDEYADQRVVDRAELGDRLVGTGQVAVNEIRRTPQFLERRHQLGRGLARLGEGPLVRLGPIVPGPENGDFFRHGALKINARWRVVNEESRVYIAERDSRHGRPCFVDLRLLFLDSPGEPIDVDDAAAVDALGDDFDTVVGVDLEGDGRAVDVNHPGAALDGESFRGRGQVFDFDECPHASFVGVQERGDRVAGGIFEIGDEPGRGQHRRHTRVGETDAIIRAHDDRKLAGQARAWRLFHRCTWLRDDGRRRSADTKDCAGNGEFTENLDPAPRNNDNDS